MIASAPKIGQSGSNPHFPLLTMLPLPFRLVPVFAGCCLLALLLSASPARADDYGFRSDYGSDFNGPNWDDDSKNPVVHHAGPPGPGDNASIVGGTGVTVTCSGGAVDTLYSNCNFVLSGAFTATSFSDVGFLAGAGTLTTQTLAGVGFDIEGGHLVAASSAAGGYVNGGSLNIASYSGRTISATAGATLTIGNSLTDFNPSIASGATLTVPGIANGMDITVTCAGADSAITIANDLSIKAGFLNVKDGAALKVGGDVLLDGGTDFDGDHIGGGGGFSGDGTLASVGGTLTVGDQAPEPGFSLGISTGAKVNSNAVSIGAQAGAFGIVGLDGADTVWNIVGQLGVGISGTGELDITNRAQLLFGGGQLFAVGLADGSHGTLTADGAGTIVDARQAVTGIGENTGARAALPSPMPPGFSPARNSSSGHRAAARWKSAAVRRSGRRPARPSRSAAKPARSAFWEISRPPVSRPPGKSWSVIRGRAD